MNKIKICTICSKNFKCLVNILDKYFDDPICSDECSRIAQGKTWPKEEDCPGCPNNINLDHKLSCSYRGGYVKIPMKLKKE